MLIPYRKNRIEDHDPEYIDARSKIDVLCSLIISGKLSRNKAVNIYEEIELEYGGHDTEKIDLFNMIYKNRIERLCDQFCGDK